MQFFRGPFRDCVLGQADLRDAVVPFLEDWNWPGSVDDFLAAMLEAEPNDDAVDLASKLRENGKRCYVASTQEAHRAAFLEQTFGSTFDALFFSCRVGRTKGDPRFYEDVTPQIGAEPNEILFLDDAEGIVDAARNAGWNAEVYAIGDDLAATLSGYGLELSS
jgi:putative hydrolase of the HAD superfamily